MFVCEVWGCWGIFLPHFGFFKYLVVSYFCVSVLNDLKLGINSGHKCNCILLWFLSYISPRGEEGGWLSVGTRADIWEGFRILKVYIFCIDMIYDFIIYLPNGFTFIPRWDSGWHLGRFSNFEVIYIYCIGMIYDFIIYTLFLRIGLSRSINTSLVVCFDYRSRHAISTVS